MNPVEIAALDALDLLVVVAIRMFT